MGKQFVAGFDVVKALIEPKETAFLLVSSVMGVIDNRQHPAHNTIASTHQKRFPFGIFVKRMMPEADGLSSHEPQGWHPVGIIAVGGFFQLQELPFVSTRPDFVASECIAH
jgi:hypothetical protein